MQCACNAIALSAGEAKRKQPARFASKRLPDLMQRVFAALAASEQAAALEFRCSEHSTVRLPCRKLTEKHSEQTMNSATCLIASITAFAVGCIAQPEVAQAASEQVVYSFEPDVSGYLPMGRLLGVGGNFYGTTYSGGSGCSRAGCGTIFEVTPSGQEKVLYAFQGGVDGGGSSGGLVELNGVLYGTTIFGGSGNGNGTVFAITPDGNFQTLHSFTGPDGIAPSGRLIAVNGVLYGMTQRGGSKDQGTVFSITPQGQVSTLYSFAGPDGSCPIDGLTAIGSTLYGVTHYGGLGYRGKPSEGQGVLFSLVPGSSETVLHDFYKSHSDGKNPNGDLLAQSGHLFGTTTGGGGGGGVVFDLKLGGGYKVLHSFANDGQDAAYLNGGLVQIGGVLYGTSQLGGSHGNGAVFSVTKAGVESVVHAFDLAQNDGESPSSGLISIGGVLYGVTAFGGSNICGDVGCGTLFSVEP